MCQAEMRCSEVSLTLLRAKRGIITDFKSIPAHGFMFAGVILTHRTRIN